jgi:hypothetical protein
VYTVSFIVIVGYSVVARSTSFQNIRNGNCSSALKYRSRSK